MMILLAGPYKAREVWMLPTPPSQRTPHYDVGCISTLYVTNTSAMYRYKKR